MRTLILCVLLAAACGSSDLPENDNPRSSRREIEPDPTTPGFDVTYSKIATSFKASQDFDPDKFRVSFNNFHEDEWEFFSNDGEKLVVRGLTIEGKGTACFFAEEDIDLVSCVVQIDGGAVTVENKDFAESKEVLETLILSVSRVVTHSLQNAPQSPTVHKESTIDVEMLIITDKSSGSGKVNFPENFGGTTVR